MKKPCIFPRVSSVILFAGFVVAILSGGFISQGVLAADSTTAGQAVIGAEAATGGMPVAMEQNAPGGKGMTEDKGKTTDRPCPGDGPGVCSSVNVQPGDSSGCTSGSKCSLENSGCGIGHTCKTTNSGGVCFCSCM